MRRQQLINNIAVQKKLGGGFSADIAIIALDVVDMKNNVQFDPDNLPQSLLNLLGSAGAASAIATTLGTTQATSGFLAALLATSGAGAALGTAEKIVTPVTPLTDFTQAFNSNSLDETIYLTPAGTLATGTVTFPTNANSRIGQTIRLVSTQIQTALTISSSGLTILGTAVTALTADTSVAWMKVAASTWLRIQ